jgi:hypothetical protein
MNLLVSLASLVLTLQLLFKAALLAARMHAFFICRLVGETCCALVMDRQAGLTMIVLVLSLLRYFAFGLCATRKQHCGHAFSQQYILKETASLPRIRTAVGVHP